MCVNIISYRIFSKFLMDKLPRSHYERLQSDDDDDDEDLPPQVHITAPGGEGTGRNSSSKHNI